MLDARGLSNSLMGTPLRLGLCLALWLCSCAYAAPLIDYTVIARYAHPNQSFTEGFELHGDTVYESSGQYGRSYIARWQLQGSQIDSWQPFRRTRQAFISPRPFDSLAESSPQHSTN